MTQFLFPPDPSQHWSDGLAEKAAEEWAQQHRVRWALLRLRERFQGPSPRVTELAPGEGRCPGLGEPELDPDETARIRRAWLRHVGRIRMRAIAELISRTQEEQQRQRERWIKAGIGPEDLKQLRRKATAEERKRRQLQLIKRLLMVLLPSCRTSREMQTCWLVAPSSPPVFLSVDEVTPQGEDGPGCCGHYFPLSKVSIWRRGLNGEPVLMSATTIDITEALWLWRQRRRLGWRMVQPPR